MKRIAIVLATILPLLSPSLAWAQNNLRPWENGPLQWSDFTVVNESIGHEHSYLEFILDIENRKRDFDGIALPVRTAVAYIDKELSWVDSLHRTPKELHYNRVLFNLVELHRRQLQVAIDTGGKVNMDYRVRLLVHEADSFCRSTRYGNDTVAVAWWEYNIRQQLDSITPIMVEKHQQANTILGYRTLHQMTLSVGGGTKFFVGDIYNYFAPSGGVYFDIDGGYRRNLFTLGLYVGGGGCKLDSINTVNPINKLYGTDKIITLDLHIDYGFAVVDHAKFILTPFIGYGMQAISYATTGETDVSNGVTDGCWRAGVDFKYNLQQGNTADFSTLSQMALAFHSKVYVSFDHFHSIIGSPKGHTINIQLGFSFRGKDQEILRPALKAQQQE